MLATNEQIVRYDTHPESRSHPFDPRDISSGTQHPLGIGETYIELRIFPRTSLQRILACLFIHTSSCIGRSVGICSSESNGLESERSGVLEPHCARSAENKSGAA